MDVKGNIFEFALYKLGICSIVLGVLGLYYGCCLDIGGSVIDAQHFWHFGHNKPIYQYVLRLGIFMFGAAFSIIGFGREKSYHDI